MASLSKKSAFVYASDFETTAKEQFKIENRTRVYIWAIKSCKIADTLALEKQGCTIDEWFDFWREQEYPPNSIVTCWFHNLTFDGQFILHYLIDNGYNHTESPVDEGDFSCIINEFASIYRISIVLPNFILNIQDSLKLLPVNLATLGQNLGISKLGESHHYDNMKLWTKLEEMPDEELIYNMRDVEILAKSLELAYSRGLNKLTLSSSVYKKYKYSHSGLMKTYMNEPKDKTINDIIDLSCKGGFTSCNPRYRNKIIHGVISLDFNSLYPSVMVSEQMPVGEPVLYTSLSKAKKDTKHPLRLYSIVVKHAEIKPGFMAFIGLRAKLFQGTYDYANKIEDETIVLWEEEYNLFNMCYHGDWVIYHVVAFQAHKSIFKKFIGNLIKEKEEISSKMNACEYGSDEYYHLKFMRFLVKREMNSLSGVFGMKKMRFSKILDGFKLVTRNIDGVDYKLKLPNYSTKESEGEYHYRAIYSRITSCARVRLISLIETHLDTILYWDTDSIYLHTNKVPDDILDMVDDDVIGKLKFEGYYKTFKYLRAKTYLKTVYNTKTKKWERKASVAGATPEVKKKLRFSNFKEGFTIKEGVSKKLLKVTGGAIIIDMPFSISIGKEPVYER